MDESLRRRQFLNQSLTLGGTALGLGNAPQLAYGWSTKRMRKPIVRNGAFDIAQGLGLTTNLKLCLDPTSSASYSGGQTWTDLSSSGTNFYRGTTNGAEASDPTYNSGGYFSCDGGDFFTYTGTNRPAWMNNVHKDNARFTIAMWLYVHSGSSGTSLGLIGNTNSTLGFFLGQTSSNYLMLNVFNNGGTAKTMSNSSMTVTHNQWALYSASLDEAVGASGAFLGVNDTYFNYNSTYTSPSALDGTDVLTIGKRHVGYGTHLANGSRIGIVYFWEGSRLTTANITSLFNKTKTRYGL